MNYPRQYISVDTELVRVLQKADQWHTAMKATNGVAHAAIYDRGVGAWFSPEGDVIEVPYSHGRNVEEALGITEPYLVTYTDARSSGARYADFESALAAIGDDMGWANPVASEEFRADSDDHTAVTVYRTEEDCDADGEGAYAPRITW